MRTGTFRSTAQHLSTELKWHCWFWVWKLSNYFKNHAADLGPVLVNHLLFDELQFMTRNYSDYLVMACPMIFQCITLFLGAASVTKMIQISGKEWIKRVTKAYEFLFKEKFRHQRFLLSHICFLNLSKQLRLFVRTNVFPFALKLSSFRASGSPE